MIKKMSLSISVFALLCGVILFAPRVHATRRRSNSTIQRETTNKNIKNQNSLVHFIESGDQEICRAKNVNTGTEFTVLKGKTAKAFLKGKTNIFVVNYEEIKFLNSLNPHCNQSKLPEFFDVLNLLAKNSCSVCAIVCGGIVLFLSIKALIKDQGLLQKAMLCLHDAYIWYYTHGKLKTE